MGNLAIIPARSGSKGLADKNIRPLAGKPMIAYTIEAAVQSGIFDEVYVSTDSPAYVEIARQWGASVPFLRDPSLATDTASSWDVVKSALSTYKAVGRDFAMVTLLQPTSPLRTSQDIIGCYHQMNELKANAVVSVCETDHSPLWCSTLPTDHSMSDFFDPVITSTPRQILPVYYRLNGAIYMVRTDYFLACRSIYDSACFAFIMNKRDSVDIDDEIDFLLAETIMEEH